MTGSASGRRKTTARPVPAGGRAAERRTALVMAVAVTTIAGYVVLAAAAASRLRMLGALGLVTGARWRWSCTAWPR